MDTNEVVNSTASFDGDVEPILPDGWKEGDDLFADSTGDELARLLADGQEADELSGLENDGATPANAAPTPGEPGADSVQDAGAQPTQTQPAGKQRNGIPADPTADVGPDGAGNAEPRYASRKLTLRVNHADEEIDVGAMTDDELRTLLQKGRAFDAMKEAENKRTYRRMYQEQVDAGMTEAAARMIAKDAADGKAYALTDDEEEQAQDAPPTVGTPETPDKPKTRDLRAEVEQLRALYPDIREMPDEVALSVSKGVPLLTAYLAWREKGNTKTAANLRKENQILKQNAANSARAPVRGVTGGDNSPAKPASLLERGFDEGLKWS